MLPRKTDGMPQLRIASWICHGSIQIRLRGRWYTVAEYTNLLGCYALSIGKPLPMFRRTLVPSSSGSSKLELAYIFTYQIHRSSYSSTLWSKFVTTNSTFTRPCFVNIFKHNQQDATLRNGIYYYKCSTCFRRSLRLSSGARNCIHSIGYLSSFFCFLPLSWVSCNNSSTIAVRSRKSSTNTRSCVCSF